MPARKPPLPTRTLDIARALRKGSTDAEQKLWQHLRAARLRGERFRRQHPVPPYIADFCCIRARLIVELDGSQHSAIDDQVRTRHLQALGFEVLRFWDHDVLVRTESVLEAIVAALERRTLSPTPLPEGEGL